VAAYIHNTCTCRIVHTQVSHVSCFTYVCAHT
jgi:hypothetical protein